MNDTFNHEEAGPRAFRWRRKIRRAVLLFPLLMLVGGSSAYLWGTGRVEFDPVNPSPAARKMYGTWQADKRIPTLKNLGGNWSTGTDFIGFRMHIDQRGSKIRGEGYFWNCIPPYGLCRVSGRIAGLQIELTVQEPEEDTKTILFDLIEEAGLPTMKPISKTFVGTLRTEPGNNIESARQSKQH